RDYLQQFGNGVGHRAEMDRDVAPLPDQIAAAVRDRRRQVASLAQQRRARRARHHQAHLLGRGREPVPDDFDDERIELHAVPRVRNRLPETSGFTCQPGGTTTVDHASSMIAGPLTISVSEARSMIAVSISWKPSNEQTRLPDDTVLTALAGRLTTVLDGR